MSPADDGKESKKAVDAPLVPEGPHAISSLGNSSAGVNGDPAAALLTVRYEESLVQSPQTCHALLSQKGFKVDQVTVRLIGPETGQYRTDVLVLSRFHVAFYIPSALDFEGHSAALEPPPRSCDHSVARDMILTTGLDLDILSFAPKRFLFERLSES